MGIERSWTILHVATEICVLRARGGGEGGERERERKRERERERERGGGGGDVDINIHSLEKVSWPSRHERRCYSNMGGLRWKRENNSYHIFEDKSEVGCGVDNVMKSDNISVFQSF